MSANLNPDSWTYGAELELSDWNQCNKLPEGCDLDRRDTTMVNSNGIAVDPKGRHYDRGGEVRTRPTETIEEQVLLFRELLSGPCYAARINYRSNLHIHIRVPGLRDDLRELKRLAEFNFRHLKKVLKIIEPIPEPNPQEFATEVEYLGARKRYRRRRRSHQTVLTEWRTQHQLEAVSVEDFFRREVPIAKNGTPLWHCQPRAAVNLRQLLETDTIEFRHFPGTLLERELTTCLKWCKTYLSCALIPIYRSFDPVGLAQEFRQNVAMRFPQFREYIHWMEIRYRATVLDGSIDRKIAIANIEKIKSGEFPV